MCYVIKHSATSTKSERFRRLHLYCAALITAQLEAISVGEFVSQHVAVPGCGLVPAISVHAVRKFIAAVTGHC